MKVALIYDYLTQFGGGERVLAAFCELFPDAPIFTLIYDEKSTGKVFEGKKIYTSFLQKIPRAKKNFRSLIFLMPLAIEQFDLSDFDLVISISHSFAKGVITKQNTIHICYCFTPPRYLWHQAQESLESFSDFKFPKIFKLFSRIILSYLRIWDFQAASRVDYFIAISKNVQQRIKKYYGRDSVIIYPPVNFNKINRIENDFGSFPEQNYFLVVGRLVPYKKFDLAIEAFLKMPDKNLLIIGDGPEFKKLEKKILKSKAKNIKLLGPIPDSKLYQYYQNCKGLIFPQEEDFGLVPLEAMAFGKPVIAFRKGGALETVVEGENGIFFNEQTPESLIEALNNFAELKFNPQDIKNHALKFDKSIFKEKIREFINSKIGF